MTPEQAAVEVLKLSRDRGFGSVGAETCDRREAVEAVIRASAAPLVEALKRAISDLAFIGEGDYSCQAQENIAAVLARWDK